MENESHGAQMWVVSERLAGAMTRPGHAAEGPRQGGLSGQQYAADLSYDEAAHRINALTD